MTLLKNLTICNTACRKSTELTDLKQCFALLFNDSESVKSWLSVTG
jgi:hypothetical protein